MRGVSGGSEWRVGRPALHGRGRSFAQTLERCLQFFRPCFAHLLWINWGPRSIRRPAWIRRTCRVRFQMTRAMSSPSAHRAVSVWTLNASTMHILQAAMAPNQPLGMGEHVREAILQCVVCRSALPQRPFSNGSTGCAAIGSGPSPSVRPLPGAAIFVISTQIA